jgi:type IV pilus assembly protein PilB
MVDMGVPGYLVASSVIAVLAQRLVRVICERCKVPYTASPGLLGEAGISPEAAEHGQMAIGKGCNYCQKKGYRGRKGIYELMKVTPALRQLVFNGAPTQEIRKLAITEGMDTLYRDGLRSVLNGITTLDEVYRIAKKTEQDAVVEAA